MTSKNVATYIHPHQTMTGKSVTSTHAHVPISTDRHFPRKPVSTLSQSLRSTPNSQTLIAPELQQFVVLRLDAIENYILKDWPPHSRIHTPLRLSKCFYRVLAKQGVYLSSQQQFLNLVATMMRQIFASSALSSIAEKRDRIAPSLVSAPDVFIHLRKPERVVLVEKTLQRLERHRPLAALTFSHRHYARLTVMEIVEALNDSEVSVRRHLRFANRFIKSHVDESDLS